MMRYLVLAFLNKVSYLLWYVTSLLIAELDCRSAVGLIEVHIYLQLSQHLAKYLEVECLSLAECVLEDVLDEALLLRDSATLDCLLVQYLAQFLLEQFLVSLGFSGYDTSHLSTIGRLLRSRDESVRIPLYESAPFVSISLVSHISLDLFCTLAEGQYDKGEFA